MKNVILSLVCALFILSACEKVVLKAPSTDTITTMSFSKDVVPVLATCNNCHTHGWTTSPDASTFYTNLVSQGYVKPDAFASSTIYSKIASGHPGNSNIPQANTDKIINWMNQGSLNN